MFTLELRFRLEFSVTLVLHTVLLQLIVCRNFTTVSGLQTKL